MTGATQSLSLCGDAIEPAFVPSDQVGELYDHGNKLVQWKHYDEALNVFRLILAQQPSHVGALNSLGGVLTRLGRSEHSLVCYDHALAVAPRTVELHINKGTALVALNRFDEAMRCFLAAIAIEPERAEAHYNASLVRLRLGDFAAWGDFEWRWRKADWADKRRNFAAPLWLGGEPIEGKTILLHAEQGLGDTIQFVRYVPLVAALGATVILESQPGLKNLLGTIQGATTVFARGEELRAFRSSLSAAEPAAGIRNGARDDTREHSLSLAAAGASRAVAGQDAGERPPAHRYMLGRQHLARQRSQPFNTACPVC